MTVSLPQSQPWAAPLADLVSRGASTSKATRLADLHAQRETTLAQFFTPTTIAAAMWAIAETAIEPAVARTPGARVRVLDIACGAGRLLQFCDAARHELTGFDVDADVVEP